MAESADDRPPESPDVQTIRQLVRLMQRYDLTAIDLGEGAHKIRLRRRGSEAVPSPATGQVPALPAIPTAPIGPPAVPAPAPRPGPSLPEPSGVFIESPMVGTFYAASSPDAPPFVSVGSVVRADSTVCVIEAMKVFTDIPAGLAGTITEVLVKNGQPVEFGQPLFRIEPA
jgi:acetyl-CoA carboxylase biotin carboxyl carrier protein